MTIAGSDPSGGAGLQADLKTFQQLGLFGMSVVTLVTVQNTQGVSSVEILSPDLIVAQLDAVLCDIAPSAIKLGALGSVPVVEAVADRLQGESCPIVIDPVLVSKHGHSLASLDVVAAYRKHLMPLGWIVTPNRYEAERLSDVSWTGTESVQRMIENLLDLGVRNVLLKGGEVDGKSMHWLGKEKEKVEIVAPRFSNNHTHGAGCVLAASITAKLAAGERNMEAAVRFGIDRTLEAISSQASFGKGVHPVDVRNMTAL